MSPGESVREGSFELPLRAARPEGRELARRRRPSALPEPMLVRNVLWFCRLRWLVVGCLTAFEILGAFPRLFAFLGLVSQRVWPLAVAATLTLANGAFLWHARRLTRSGAAARARSNLWAQIALDLVVLTVVVHFVGSLDTYVAFAFLFHIVLACIFFSRSQSLVVTLLACGLYVLCVTTEMTGLLPPAGVYADAAARRDIQRARGTAAINVGTAVATWLVVWYLGSRLSDMVRDRDSKLAATNRRLVEAQEEKTRHMLHTTHELKAPFAAIHANAQLLLRGYCGDLSPDAREVVGRIATRARRLASEIQEMLQLANLRSVKRESLSWVELDVAEVLRGCVAQLEPMAAERNVRFDVKLEPAPTVAVEDHLKMLLTNVLANAVSYSHNGGVVGVRCGRSPEGRARMVVEDRGIGIAPEKLPRIFDEYYRTEEAARHNKESSGLGLAIVKEVAQAHGIRVRVTSRPGEGTTFELLFWPAGEGVREMPSKEV